MSNGYDSQSGEGWVGFAGIMILIVGVLDILWGISAIANSHILVNNQAVYTLEHRHAWGWTELIFGVVLVLAAFSIWAGNEFGRWVGIIVAGLNAISQLAHIPAFPWWSLTIFVIDILIIYGLIVYGGRGRSPA